MADRSELGGKVVDPERSRTVIRGRRLELGRTQSEAARLAGVAASQWSRWETCGSPAVRMLPQIAGALDLAPSDLIDALKPDQDRVVLRRVERKIDELLERLTALESRL